MMPGEKDKNLIKMALNKHQEGKDEVLRVVSKEEAEYEEKKLAEKMDKFFLGHAGASHPPQEIEEYTEEEESLDIYYDNEGNIEIVGEVEEKKEMETPATAPSFVDNLILEHVIQKRLDAYRKTRRRIDDMALELSYINHDLVYTIGTEISKQINALESVLFLEQISLDSLEEPLRKEIESQAREMFRKILKLTDEFNE